MDINKDKQMRQFSAEMAVRYGFYSPVAQAVKASLAVWGQV